MPPDAVRPVIAGKQTLDSSVPTAQAQTLSFKARFSLYLNFSTDVWECGMHLQESLLRSSFLDIHILEIA